MKDNSTSPTRHWDLGLAHGSPSLWQDTGSTKHISAETEPTMSNYSLDSSYLCSQKALLLPIFNEQTWSTGVRIFLYLLAMSWCFLGVAVASDVFMCGIEHITSKTKAISVSTPDGKGAKVIEVKIWNDTVANLTLLSFGTSAPEILLSVIEICGHSFSAGELGPGTIVGSAAFNLFAITAVCIMTIPDGETRKIKNLTVFAITTSFGIFAYVWLILVLMVISPEVVELWEAIVTLLLFPAMILLSFAADKDVCRKRGKVSSEVEIGLNLDTTSPQAGESAVLIDMARELARGRMVSEDEAARAMAAKITEGAPKPTGWYRVQATRLITGGQRLTPAPNLQFKDMATRITRAIRLGGNKPNGKREAVFSREPSGQVSCAMVEFTAATCAVMESEGHVRIGVRRTGDMSSEVRVGLETIDGTAEAESDYRPVNQILTFGPNEKGKDIFVDIINDHVWEPDAFFFVKLFHHPGGSTQDQVTIGKLSINQVTIINDIEPGRLEFSKPSYIVKESSETAQLIVRRVNGADGEVKVTWKTHDMTARAGHEYLGRLDTVTFKHGETSKAVAVDIIGIGEDTHEPNFQVELSNVTGGAQIGRISKTTVTIINDQEFNNLLSRIAIKAQKNLDGLKLDTSTWTQQFRSAMNVNGGEQDGATSVDYILHFLTFFWKVLFALIPPPSYCGGWLTFWLSLAMIGLITALISDMASIFGCLVGLSDYITAITFVALGTSMPDTFASRSAAMNEKWADSSIGNINGSNSVNVFLGLGLPWLLAAAFWQSKGKQFVYPTGPLALSVSLFTGSAVVVIAMLVCRRKMSVFGEAELGGPSTHKYLTAGLSFFLWIFYVIVSSLQAQGIIEANL